jgi:methionine-rich copper-binding protein CopC
MKPSRTRFAILIGCLAMIVPPLAPARAAIPSITVLSPANGATGVSATVNLSITFSEAVKAESGDIKIVRLSDKVTVETIRVSDSSKVLPDPTTAAKWNITRAVTLAANTRYSVQIAATAFESVSTNQSFGGIESEGTWTFTTAATTATTTTVAPATTTTTVKPAAAIGGTRCPRAGAVRRVDGRRFVCKRTTVFVWRRG